MQLASPNIKARQSMFLTIAERMNKIHSYLASGVDKIQNLFATTKSNQSASKRISQVYGE